nr:hypothetical protein BaRGS_031812 [Batillaria attramentaria]
MTILMGDFNAKIGSDNTGYEDTMGTHGLGQMNENGERFADFCALNQLVIGGSIFPHKRIHKATWRSPDHVTENQIDHICISRKFRRSWRDVRVMRDIPPAETELLINCDKPSKAEIRKAIMTLRNGKAAGPDEIPAEAIKADTETAVNMLHSLFSKIWEKEEAMEKAFDSVDREALWKLLRHYGVPGKIISLIQCTYQDDELQDCPCRPVVRKL